MNIERIKKIVLSLMTKNSIRKYYNRLKKTAKI